MAKGSPRKRALAGAMSAKSPKMTVDRSANNVTLSWSAQDAQAPTDMFVADFSDVLRTTDGISLIFGKKRPYSNKLQHLVEVSIVMNAFRALLWPTLQDAFYSGLVEHCGNLPPRPEDEAPNNLDSADYHTIRANLARVSYAGEEAAIDFFMFSTHDASEAILGRRTNVDVAALLRVLLTTQRLLDVLEGCKGILDEEADQ